MNIQQSSTNFNGGFLLKNVPQPAREELPTLIKKGRQIFYDFKKEGDIFLVLRDEKDHKGIKFIKENNLKFEYYPDISTKSGLDSEEPVKLMQLTAIYAKNVITSLNGVKKAIASRKKLSEIEQASPEYISKILKALCIDNKSRETKIVKGASFIDDPEFSRRIFISPPSKNNIHYVLIEPYAKHNSSRRYAIDSEGNILVKFESPEGMKKFQENFNKLLIKG